MLNDKYRGSDWMDSRQFGMPTSIERMSPVEFNEAHRYLPQGVTPRPGLIQYDLFPFLREILECFDPLSPVREVNLMKGVQTGYTTLLESVLLYYIAHIKTQAAMFITADKELASGRMDNNILPMINHSGFSHLIRSSDIDNQRKTGKALALNTCIPTPHGMREMGDLSVGDVVFSMDGSPTKIVTESPVQTRQCYKIEFANGDKIIASDEHRWFVHRHGLKDTVKTTRDLYDAGVRQGKSYRFRIPVCDPVQGAAVQLPIKPYTLGAWLGDGSSQDPYLAVGDYGGDILGQIRGDGYTLKQYKTKPGKCPLYAIKASNHRVRTLLRLLSLIGNKHIPEIYLSAPIKDRLRLLQGLMDTDGSCDTRGRCEITQKNKMLAYGCWRLANSLGFKATIKSRIARCQNGTESTVHRVSFFASRKDHIFTIDAKQSRLKTELAPRSYRNSIVLIEQVGFRKVKCIGVDHPSELFLCGEGYIPTHNTKDYLQWAGGGFLIYNGAVNATKMRQYSVPLMLKDEVDGWKRSVGKDGNSDALTDARCSAYWTVRKILRGSTPLLEPSLIGEAFERGDQRKYQVLCKACSFPQELRQEHRDEETGLVGGFRWDMDGGMLILDSVRYCCRKCGHAHYESDKERLFSEEHGAHWKPTCEPKEPGIRSYHLPAFYSPFGFRPWYKCISDYLESFDPETRQVKSVSKLQEYYNNTLGTPFKVLGSQVRFINVSSHRRAVYRLGEIPNAYAKEYSDSRILFLTCQVDVHLRSLAVVVMGWTREARCYVIDYWRFEPDKGDTDCDALSSAVWGRLRELIENHEYVADDGTKYHIVLTLIDAGYSNDTVTTFCGDYGSGVYPILGRDRTAKNQVIKEFAEFKTQSGTVGYRILVDHYKDRMASILRRDWTETAGVQKMHHFNAPVDITDKQLKELTVETRRERKDDRGGSVYQWFRKGNAPNELWDLLGYGYAAVEILAWHICIQHFEQESVDWLEYWDFVDAEENDAIFGRGGREGVILV